MGTWLQGPLLRTKIPQGPKGLGVQKAVCTSCVQCFGLMLTCVLKGRCRLCGRSLLGSSILFSSEFGHTIILQSYIKGYEGLPILDMVLSPSLCSVCCRLSRSQIVRYSIYQGKALQAFRTTDGGPSSCQVLLAIHFSRIEFRLTVLANITYRNLFKP